MPSANRIILASAGSGKTTSLVTEADDRAGERCALVTYTLNGRAELSGKAYELFGRISPHVAISTWYSFILTHFVRPYQNHLYEPRIKAINFNRVPVYPPIPKSCVSRFYFSSSGRLWRDRVTDFAVRVIDETEGLPLRRIEKIFKHIYIDEAQDLSGWDLELVEKLLQTEVNICLIGDHRQATFSTNDNPKNKAYWGGDIIKKFEEWAKAGHVVMEHHAHSYRCNQAICDFADAVFPDCPKTTSRNSDLTGHDGLFFVRSSDIAAYVDRYAPQPLRYNRLRKVEHGRPLNFGEAKGMTFDRVLIYPHGPFEKYIGSGNLAHAGKELAKTYVAITRARYSVGFVVPDKFKSTRLPYFEPAGKALIGV